MASNEFNVNPHSSDEEEVFAGFSVEEIADRYQLHAKVYNHIDLEWAI